MITDKQISALKYLICKSRDCNDLAKRMCIFLINASERMTTPVSLTLTQDKEGYTADEIRGVAHAMDAMTSCNCSFHQHALMMAMGSELYFSLHYGHYDDSTGKFNSEGQFGKAPPNAPGHENDRGDMPLRYTFWLHSDSYGHAGKGTPLVTSRQELEAIVLSAHGLYS